LSPFALITGTSSMALPFSDRSESLSFNSRDVTSSSVYLTWTVSQSLQQKLSSFTLRYKALGDRDWLFTRRLIFSTMGFKLKCLSPSRWYTVQLIGFPLDGVLGETFFNTPSVSG